MIRVKLVKGPMNNKVYQVEDTMCLRLTHFKNKQVRPVWANGDDPNPYSIADNLETVTYAPVEVKDFRGRVAYAMNTKGEHLFEYQGKQ